MVVLSDLALVAHKIMNFILIWWPPACGTNTDVIYCFKIMYGIHLIIPPIVSLTYHVHNCLGTISQKVYDP